LRILNLALILSFNSILRAWKYSLHTVKKLCKLYMHITANYKYDL
jgi:hypothetical protein